MKSSDKGRNNNLFQLILKLTEHNLKIQEIKGNIFMLFKLLRSIAIAILVVSIAAISVQAQKQSKSEKDELALTALIKQMTEAQSKFDSAVLEKIYASDYVEVSPIGEVDPREKAIGFYKPQPNAPSNERPLVTTHEFQIRSYGNFAVVIARFTFTGQEGSEAAKRAAISFRATLACRKENGVWKIVSVQTTGIRPSRPQQAK